MTYLGATGVNHGGQGASTPEFGVGDANPNYPPGFQKYRSEFTETRHFKRKFHFFLRRGLAAEGPCPLPIYSYPGGPHSWLPTKPSAYFFI